MKSLRAIIILTVLILAFPAWGRRVHHVKWTTIETSSTTKDKLTTKTFSLFFNDNSEYDNYRAATIHGIGWLEAPKGIKNLTLQSPITPCGDSTNFKIKLEPGKKQYHFPGSLHGPLALTIVIEEGKEKSVLKNLWLNLNFQYQLKDQKIWVLSPHTAVNNQFQKNITMSNWLEFGRFNYSSKTQREEFKFISAPMNLGKNTWGYYERKTYSLKDNKLINTVKEKWKITNGVFLIADQNQQWQVVTNIEAGDAGEKPKTIHGHTIKNFPYMWFQWHDRIYFQDNMSSC